MLMMIGVMMIGVMMVIAVRMMMFVRVSHGSEWKKLSKRGESTEI
jgi:uncharacterized membrane protein